MNTSKQSKEAYLEIKNHFLNHEYQEVIDIAVEASANFIIITNPIAWYYCGVAYQKCSNIDEALKCFQTSIENGANSKLKVSIARRLNDTKYANYSLKYLTEAVCDPNYDEELGFFLLGKKALYLGDNNRALELFERALKLAQDDKAQERINNYIQKTKTRILMGSMSIDFNLAKSTGFNIKNGHIVYLKGGANYNLATSDNRDMSNQPYLVFHATENTVFAYPLLFDNNNGYYQCLIKSTDSGLSKDCYAVPSIASFDINDIRKVSGELNSKYFNDLMYRLFRKISHQKRGDLTFEEKLFISLYGVTKTPENCDIVTFYHSESLSEKYYFLTDINEEDYSGYYLEIKNGLYHISSDISSISKDTILTGITTPSLEIKNMLLEEIGLKR